jgi:ABC-type nitrate/sulfonate/bicarbonate transport system substrate-binding protein
MKSFSSTTKKTTLIGTCLFFLLTTDSGYAAEGLQKLRVAYAAITAAFSIPWVAKEAGIFQRHGLDVELVYIAAGSRAVQTLVGGSIDVAAIGGPAGVDAKLAGGGHGLYRYTGKSGACVYGGRAEYSARRGAAR